MGCAESTPLAELQSGGLTKEQSIDGELTAGPVAVTCVRGFSALGGTNTVTGVGMGMGGAGGGINGDGGSRCPPMWEIKARAGQMVLRRDGSSERTPPPRRASTKGAALGPKSGAAVRPLRSDDSRPLLYCPHLAPPMPFPIRRDQRADDRRVAPPTIPAAPEAGQRGALLRDDAEPEDADQGLCRPRGASELIERAQLSSPVL